MTTFRSEIIVTTTVRSATLGDLLRALERLDGCRVEGISGMSHPHGGVRSRRVVRGGTGNDDPPRHAVLPNIDDRDLISVLVIRSICRRLGLDPAPYGG